MDERISTLTRKPMQPDSHPCSHTRTAHCTSNTATNNAPYPCPIMTSALALCMQSQHHNANPARLSACEIISPLRRYISVSVRAGTLPSTIFPAQSPHSQLRCLKVVHEVFPNACTTNVRPESSMIQHILPELRPQSVQLSWQPDQRPTSQTHAHQSLESLTINLPSPDPSPFPSR